jgi:hypothetical protein
MATISLNDYLLQPMPIHVGDLLQYSGYVHGSVGNNLDYELSENEVLAYQNYASYYHHPENMKDGWTGGDAATGTYIFEARKSGTARLVLLHLFRGSVEVRHELDITVQ